MRIEAIQTDRLYAAPPAFADDESDFGWEEHEIVELIERDGFLRTESLEGDLD